MKIHKFAAMSAAALALCGLCRSASAQSVEEFYKGKTVTIMIGYGPGGTDDVWARLLAKYMPEHIPGKPTVVASNVPGAGSLLLTNQIYNTQPKDGTVIGDYLADLLVDGWLILELKAVKALAPEHVAQILGYLKSSRLRHGLLINFGSYQFEINKYVL